MNAKTRLAIPLAVSALCGLLSGCAGTTGSTARSTIPATQPIAANQGHAAELVLPGRELALASQPGDWEFGRRDGALGVRGIDAVASSFAPPPPDLRFARRINIPDEPDQFLVPYAQPLFTPWYGRGIGGHWGPPIHVPRHHHHPHHHRGWRGGL